jgi:hypothetical protein
VIDFYQSVKTNVSDRLLGVVPTLSLGLGLLVMHNIRRRDHGEETLAEIGRSYNVSGWTIARLTA